MKQTCNDCELMLSELHGKYSHLKDMFNSLSTCIPDLVWAKDLNGYYKYANSSLSYNLYRTTVTDVLGKNDKELAQLCKDKLGCNNFTFGQMCSDSDREVLRCHRSMKFLERGIIDGDEVILMVHKNVEKDIHGNVIGTVGIGRDVTYEYTKLKEIANDTTDKYSAEKIEALITRHYYENKDNGE